MSFAEFERGVISERTRDKIAATRRKGMWTGGPPPLGYQLDRGRLVVVPDEAARVREIFGLYLKLGTLNELVSELNRRGWTTKPGRHWGKSSAHHFLTRILFIGKVPYRDEVHEGQHEAIIDRKTYDAVQKQLRQHGQRGGSEARNKWALLLRGVLFCGRCGAKMAHTYSSKNDRRWHYYLCPTLETPGSDRYDGHRVAAREIEAFVMAKVREAARNPEIVTLTARAAQAEAERKRPELLAEQRRIGAETKQIGDERRNLVAVIGKAGSAADTLVDRLNELDDREQRLRNRLAEVHAELMAIERAVITEDEVRAALDGFDEVWAELLPREQQRLVVNAPPTPSESRIPASV